MAARKSNPREIEVSEITAEDVMFLDKNPDLFNTPRLRYYNMRKAFDRKFLNPKVWKYKYGTKRNIQCYDNLLRSLEKTEEFCDLDPSLSTSIQTDNINLILDDLPLPRKRREELHDYMLAGNNNQNQEGKLKNIKNYFEKKKKCGFLVFEARCRKEIQKNRESYQVEKCSGKPKGNGVSVKAEVKKRECAKINKKPAEDKVEVEDMICINNKKFDNIKRIKSEAETKKKTRKSAKVMNKNPVNAEFKIQDDLDTTKMHLKKSKLLRVKSMNLLRVI